MPRNIQIKILEIRKKIQLYVMKLFINSFQKDWQMTEFIVKSSVIS